jgi:hypothetical protein
VGEGANITHQKQEHVRSHCSQEFKFDFEIADKLKDSRYAEECFWIFQENIDVNHIDDGT